MYQELMPGLELHFIYKDSNNKVTEQNITLIKNEDYKFSGKSLNDNKYRTYLHERVLMDLFDSNDSTDILIAKYQSKYKEHVPVSRGPKDTSKLNLDNKVEIQFTGFYSTLKMDQKNTKQDLIKLAEDNDLFVKKSKSLGANVSLLVCGPNAGPKKMIKASEKGSILLSEVQFLHMIASGGEIQDNE